LQAAPKGGGVQFGGERKLKVATLHRTAIDQAGGGLRFDEGFGVVT
jgi:hypothetical protein